jgi:hypothetical protein
MISQVSLKYITMPMAVPFKAVHRLIYLHTLHAEQELAPSFSASCTMSIQHETKEGLPRRHRARFPSAFLDKQHIKKNEANIYNPSV